MELKISNALGHSIPDDLFGLFFEDINYAADGGLYAEMLENRGFEFVDVYGEHYDYYTVDAPEYGWSVVNGGRMMFVTGSPVSEVNPHYLRFFADKPGQGFKNKAYAGIYMKAGLPYKVSFWARAAKYWTGDVKVAVMKDGVEITSKVVELIHEERGVWQKWNRYELELTADADVKAGEFSIFLTEAGEVEFDFISMMPGDAVGGVFRKDLFEALKELKPGFIRFPGGCIIEGNTLANRYQWKKSVGRIEDRRSNWNRWAIHEGEAYNQHTPFSHYNQTLGMGYYEYFLLCDLLGAKPLPVLNVGLACQYQSLELIEPEDPMFNEFIQDALDLIEFANGDATTKWGALRASMGHSEPFNLTMMGIGNEQWETPKSRFFERYMAFEKAIHEKYPEMRLIGSAGPDVISDHWTAAWDFINKQAAVNPSAAYAVDEHYYMPPVWFTEHADFYDEYPRDVKVFSGEYAAHPARGTAPGRHHNTTVGALSEAAFLTGVEKNSDVVVLSSYAPLFARKDFTQWAPDMIWFDSESVDRTPSYYVQKMYSCSTATDTIPMDGQEKTFREKNVFISVTYDRNADHRIIKVVNMNDEEFPLTLTIDGVGCGACETCAMAPASVTMEQMTAVDETHAKVETSKVPFTDSFKLPAKSFTIITL